MSDENEGGMLTPNHLARAGISPAHTFIWLDGRILHMVERFSFEGVWADVATVREGSIRIARLRGTIIEIELLWSDDYWPHSSIMAPRKGASVMISNLPPAAQTRRVLPGDAPRPIYDLDLRSMPTVPPLRMVTGKITGMKFETAPGLHVSGINLSAPPPSIKGTMKFFTARRDDPPPQPPVRAGRRARTGDWWIINCAPPGKPVKYWTGHLDGMWNPITSTDHLDAGQFDTKHSAEFQASMLGLKAPWRPEHHCWDGPGEGA